MLDKLAPHAVFIALNECYRPGYFDSLSDVYGLTLIVDRPDVPGTFKTCQVFSNF